jgi:hypothetical protein
MNLRELAEADNAFLLEDDVAGFGVAIMLTDLAGNVYQVKGQYHRVGVDVDPETGLMVPGNRSTVTVRLASLGGVLPDDGWLVETKDITGATVRGKASSVMLDRTAGRATMILKR